MLVLISPCRSLQRHSSDAITSHQFLLTAPPFVSSSTLSLQTSFQKRGHVPQRDAYPYHAYSDARRARFTMVPRTCVRCRSDRVDPHLSTDPGCVAPSVSYQIRCLLRLGTESPYMYPPPRLFFDINALSVLPPFDASRSASNDPVQR